MIGQSFAPLGNPNDPNGRPRPGGASPTGPAQQAIRVLNLRLPRVVGAGAGAPQPLLASPGSGGIPFGGGGPQMPPGGLEDIIRRMFDPQAQPQGMPGGMPQAPGMPPPAAGGAPPPFGKPPNPRTNFHPLPGGTAGRNPGPGGGGADNDPVPGPRNPRGNSFSGFGPFSPR